jgi:hypothetical protein
VLMKDCQNDDCVRQGLLSLCFSEAVFTA